MVGRSPKGLVDEDKDNDLLRELLISRARSQTTCKFIALAQVLGLASLSSNVLPSLLHDKMVWLDAVRMVAEMRDAL